VAVRVLRTDQPLAPQVRRCVDPPLRTETNRFIHRKIPSPSLDEDH
jgi:hypothetical protein